MVKQIAFFSIISFLISCHEQTAHPDYAVLIKGDWIDTTQHIQTRYISFEDSICYGHFWSRSGYQIQNDTLYMKSLNKHRTNETYKYAILQLTADSLMMVTAKHEDYMPDTVIVSKIKAKNNISPHAVYFASTGCFGTCPIMYLEIDSSLQVKFYGESYTPVTGGYSGAIARYQYNHILDRIRNIPLNSLQPFYKASGSDAQIRGIAIVNGDSVIKTASYGSYREPLELDLLYNQLEYLFDPTHLHADSTVTRQYFAKHLKNVSVYNFISPPPPPPPLSRKIRLHATH